MHLWCVVQVIKDYQRGWAWTRALLGLQADEIHVCGEAAAIDLVMLVKYFIYIFILAAMPLETVVSLYILKSEVL